MPRRLVFCGWSLSFDFVTVLPVARLLTQFPPWALGVGRWAMGVGRWALGDGRKQAMDDKATRQKQVRNFAVSLE